MNNSTAVIAILMSGFVCGLGAWGAADITRNYRGQEVEQECNQAREQMKKSHTACETERHACRTELDLTQEAHDDVEAKLVGCQKTLKKQDADLAIAYGLLKAGPPECVAAIIHRAAEAQKKHGTK